MSDEKISPDEAGELAACFAVHAPQLFGYACVVARGDRAYAQDLVQAAFEAAGRSWRVLRPLSQDQRRGWLMTTLATIAVTGSRGEETPRPRPAPEPRPPRLEAGNGQDPKTPDRGSEPSDPAEGPFRPFPARVAERCWQVIRNMPEPQHAVALLRWQQGMKENEIAAALGMAEKTVITHLAQARRKLTAKLGPDGPVTGPFTDADPEAPS